MSDQCPICEVRLRWLSLVWAALVKSWAGSKSRTCKKREAGARTSKRRLLSRSAGFASLLLLVGSVFAGVPGHVDAASAGKQPAPPRVVGKKAVMHVYYYAPKTLEITAVSSQFFKDVDTCERAVSRALRAATAHPRGGDLVVAQCVAIDAPEPSAQPEVRHRLAEVTEL